MRGQAAQERVVPEVAETRITPGKAVMGDRQAFLGGGSPDRIQVRMIERVVERKLRLNTDRPR